MVVTRSQLRWALLLGQLSAEQRERQAQALSDFPALALDSHSVRSAPPVSYTGDRLVEVAPADHVLWQTPAIATHPRSWLVERWVFGEEIEASHEVVAHTSAFVVHSLGLRRYKRFRSGALSIA